MPTKTLIQQLTMLSLGRFKLIIFDASHFTIQLGILGRKHLRNSHQGTHLSVWRKMDIYTDRQANTTKQVSKDTLLW